MKPIVLAIVVVLFGAVPGWSQTFSSPVSYCKAVGTIDRPDARYTGPKLPPWMATQLNLKSDQGKLMEWRCADHAVLACVYGANIPCASKANTDAKPTTPIAEFCRTNPSSSFVPMVVTGHETSISWACRNGAPYVLNAQPVDAQGYVKAYWKTVSP